ncbi:phosphotransferase family protein [Actinoplanes sp. RD1]|uniref:phosphotransferase family protein n=1 Tax=Actinoplanes sp. RD1 TaxID=3064538 RepID=UPI002741CEBF|nr:aminoglycoside 3'-phosphotransferase/choline kinase family protein [Actinoplanes sp. RD1]
MSGLPRADTGELYDAVGERDLRPGVEALLRRLGADAASVERIATGSLPVYAAGEVVLKLFPQVYAAEVPVEAGVLRAVHGRLPIPTPRLLGQGEHDGWGFVLMERLRGTPLSEAWDGIGDKEALARELGRATAALHAVPAPDIAEWWPRDWDDFVSGQRRGAVQRQRERGLDAAWLARIPEALDVELPGGDVLLHTEIMREHLLVEHGRISGLIDFEPAMRGAPEYDFVGVGVFVAQGDRRFLRAFLEAYGHPCDDGFPRRMVAWSLLHCYSNLPRWMGHMPVPEEADFAELGRRWYGT